MAATKTRKGTSKAKTKSTSTATNGGGRRGRPRNVERDNKLREQVVARLEKGEKLSQVAKDLGITAGKAAFLKMEADVKPKDRIKGKDDAELGKAIVAARAEGLSWGIIAARAALPVGRVYRLYEQTSGKPVKGSRVPRSKATNGAGSKAAVKRSTRRKAASNPS